MNLPLFFNRSAQFLEFKRLTNHPSALEFVFNLGSTCQNGRSFSLELPIQYVPYILGLPQDLDPRVALQALIDTKMIGLEAEGGDKYRIHVFEASNSQLKACWTNGAKGGRPKVNPVSAADPKAEESFVPF